MGYFSNGTEGEIYQEEWCNRCFHDIKEDCVVWLLHLQYSYKECNNTDNFLHKLIPREGVANKQCKMFVERN